jgi:putative lipoprotein
MMVRSYPRARRAVILGSALVIGAIGCLPRVRRQQPVDVTTVFTCGGDYRFSVRELGEVATVRAERQTFALPRIRSATGARYRQGDMEFLNRGQTATLRLGGAAHSDCTGQVVSTAWDESRLLGVDYRAAGNEPTWSLEIDDGNYMRFMVAGGSPVYTAVPDAAGDGGRRVFRTGPDSMGVEVIVEEIACRNPTSPDPFPHTVTVMYNGFPYRGCGRPLGA